MPPRSQKYSARHPPAARDLEPYGVNVTGGVLSRVGPLMVPLRP